MAYILLIFSLLPQQLINEIPKYYFPKRLSLRTIPNDLTSKIMRDLVKQKRYPYRCYVSNPITEVILIFSLCLGTELEFRIALWLHSKVGKSSKNV